MLAFTETGQQKVRNNRSIETEKKEKGPQLHRTTVLEMMAAAQKISSDPVLRSDDTAVAARACRFPLKRLIGRDRDMSVLILHDWRLHFWLTKSQVCKFFFGRFRRLEPGVCGRAWLMNYLSNQYRTPVSLLSFTFDCCWVTGMYTHPIRPRAALRTTVICQGGALKALHDSSPRQQQATTDLTGSSARCRNFFGGMGPPTFCQPS